MDPEPSLVVARMNQRPSVALLVPTRNAEQTGILQQWREAVREQTRQPDERWVVDTCSCDRTADLLKADDWTVVSISPEEFDHGSTRNQLWRATSAEICVFMTQDAVWANPAGLEEILKPFADPRVAVVSARQLPRPGAGLLEAHARIFNYPSQGWVAGAEDIPRLGVKVAFVSNSCAAWRRSALEAIGGFPETLMGEDTLAAATLLQSGWKVAYCAESTVYHSHNYTIREEARRYFDIGVFHRFHPEYLKVLGKPEGEGKAFVRHQLRWLWRHGARVALPGAILRLFAKYGAYRLGRDYLPWIPSNLRPRLSLHPNWWRAHSNC